jgi:deoxyhypusine synthase
VDHHNFKGKDIPHLKIKPNMDIDDLVEIFASTGYNARHLEMLQNYTVK